MRLVLQRTLLLAVLAACHHEAREVRADQPAASVSTRAVDAPTASVAPTVAAASATSPAPATPPIDAGPFVEDTSAFGGAPIQPLRVELLPPDQRARDDGKKGFARVARLGGSAPGLATFGFVTCDDSSGGHCFTQSYARPARSRPLAHAAAPAVSFATYRATNAPDPTPSLLVLEDSTRAPVAVRFMGIVHDVSEVALFDDAPAFFVQRLGFGEHAWGFEDRVPLDVIAYVDGALVRVARFDLGFREVDACPSGSGQRTLGPPGSVTITARGEHAVIHAREATSACDGQPALLSGCAGIERDWDWDAAKKRFVPRGPGTRITLHATAKGC